MARRINSGTSVGGPLLQNTQSAINRQEVTGIGFRGNPRLWYEEFNEFSASALTTPWATRTAKTAGSPTVALLANTADGVWEGALDNTSEAQTAGVDWGDSLLINKPDAGAVNVNAVSTPAFQAYVSFPTALTTAQTAVIGLATAFNATLTSISKYAWFRLSANMNVLFESKDGTTTSTGNAPAAGTYTLTAGTFALFTIDWTFLDQVKFWVSTGQGDNLLGTLNMTGLASTDNFQPVMYVQKSTGTTTPKIDMDWCHTLAWRY